MNTYNPPSSKPSSVTRVQRIGYNNNQSKAELDDVISEEPLQISLAWYDPQATEQSQVFTITMRTPGDDIELTLGLLLSEGQITDMAQIEEIHYDGDDGYENDNKYDNEYDSPLPNQLTVQLRRGIIPDLTDFQRQLVSQSSCGICGKTSLKSLELKAPKPLDRTAAWLNINQLKAMPERLQAQQSLFAQTGGVHGAALFNQHYELLSLKEDIGRHNAVDKVIGDQLQRYPDETGQQQILLVSGRVSFELVQKAVVAGYAVLIAVGAPSSLAISAARRFDLTLIGFTKPDSFNVYHGQWRIETNEHTPG